MIRKIATGCTCFALLALGSTAQASTVNVSLDPNDWSVSYSAYPYQASSTLTQVGDDLRGTILTANAGSAYGMQVGTNGTYNFQNATLRFQWLVNGLGSYSQASSHLASDEGNVSHYIAANSAYYGFTTHHSYNSQLIADNTWMYTEITYTPTGLTYTVSYDGYGLSPISQGTNLYDSTIWDRLDDARFQFRLVDNYLANQYFQLGEVTLITPNAVPIPPTVLLLGSGLAGLAGSRLRRKKK